MPQTFLNPWDLELQPHLACSSSVQNVESTESKKLAGSGTWERGKKKRRNNIHSEMS